MGKSTPIKIQKYLGKISGPLMDRIDIHIEVPSVSYEEISKPDTPVRDTSSSIRERIVKARKIQFERFEGIDIRTNSQMERNVKFKIDNVK